MNKVLLIVILLFPLWLSAQINDSLKVFSELIQLESDTTCWNCKSFERSRSYDITIQQDTLSIRVASRDRPVSSNDTADCCGRLDFYKMSVKDIAEVKYDSIVHDQMGLRWTESYIKISALRQYPLFKHIYKGVVLNDNAVKLRVVNQNNAKHFMRLSHFLNDNLDIDSNAIAPRCIFESIQIDTSLNQTIEMIKNSDLETPISLNGKVDLSQELEEILLGYLKEENIMKVYGHLIIDENHEMIYFSNYQNEMYNHLQNLDSIPIAYKVIQRSGFLRITNEQKSRIEELLKGQVWKTGRCYNKHVNSYLEFYIENPAYVKSKDDK